MFRPRHAVLLLVAIVAAWVALHRIASAPQPPADPAQVRREVLAVFEQGARAWNAGDLDGFMATYLPDSETTFITKTGVLHGVAAIRHVYAARFAPGAVRDSLHFQGVEIDILAPDVVNAIAWYVLVRGDSITERGPTSLVMRRVSGRWRIVHDHSS
jgi:uncharacterized protein (TIGR02246 family)